MRVGQLHDAEQFAVGVEERCAAVVGNRRAREDRRLDVIFPIAREGTRADQAREAHFRAAAAAGRDEQRLPGVQAGYAGQRNRLDTPQRHQRAYQAESGGKVVRHLARGQDAFILGDDLDGFGFEQQVADGQDEPVGANHDTRTRAPLAQALGGGGAFGRGDVECDDRIARALERPDLRVGRCTLRRVGRGRSRKTGKEQGAAREQAAEPSGASAREPGGQRRSNR